VEAMTTLSSFFGYTLSKTPYPVCTWTASSTNKAVNVSVKTTAARLTDVIVWEADSPDMDFRNDKWQSRSLGVSQQSVVNVTEEFPASGYKAFYINLKYKDAKGEEHTESTRVFMTDDKKIF